MIRNEGKRNDPLLNFIMALLCRKPDEKFSLEWWPGNVLSATKILYFLRNITTLSPIEDFDKVYTKLLRNIPSGLQELNNIS